MAHRDIVAIGASAGGVEALIFLAKNYPADFPASILVTLHLSSRFPSSLDGILARNGPLPASFADDGHLLRPGRLYIAPPDRHLLVDGDRLRLGAGPRENNARPAIDPMLRSVAVCCGARAIGVVLTGTLGDGASGLCAVSRCGGMTVVQDPDDAAFPDMPLNALSRVRPDHIISLVELPTLLEQLVRQPAGEPVPAPESIRFEVDIARDGGATMDEMDRLGRRSVLSCPDCSGVMWEIDQGELIRYRCHVGHTYTAELMSLALDENLRRALGSAQRALEERVALARKLEADAQQRGQSNAAEDWRARAREYEREMNVIKQSVRRMDQVAAADKLARREEPEEIRRSG